MVCDVAPEVRDRVAAVATAALDLQDAIAVQVGAHFACVDVKLGKREE